MKRKKTMNKHLIKALLKDGAYLNISENRFYHPSIPNGYRIMKKDNIFFLGAKRILRSQLKYCPETQIFKIN
jgi:hypothetical protein